MRKFIILIITFISIVSNAQNSTNTIELETFSKILFIGGLKANYINHLKCYTDSIEITRTKKVVNNNCFIYQYMPSLTLPVSIDSILIDKVAISFDKSDRIKEIIYYNPDIKDSETAMFTFNSIQKYFQSKYEVHPFEFMRMNTGYSKFIKTIRWSDELYRYMLEYYVSTNKSDKSKSQIVQLSMRSK